MRVGSIIQTPVITVAHELGVWLLIGRLLVQDPAPNWQDLGPDLVAGVCCKLQHSLQTSVFECEGE